MNPKGRLTDMAEQSYIEDDVISLIEYTHNDDRLFYECWSDVDTQKGYNSEFDESFDEFSEEDITRFRLWCSIVLKGTGERIGVVRLSPPEYEPDFAIWIYKPFRAHGYGTRAFRLGLTYCTRSLNLERVWAGCYANNTASRRMLEKLRLTRDESGDTLERDTFTGEPLTQLSYVYIAEKNREMGR